jgi:hypothetical protein
MAWVYQVINYQVAVRTTQGAQPWGLWVTPTSATSGNWKVPMLVQVLVPVRTGPEQGQKYRYQVRAGGGIGTTYNRGSTTS